ncbi:hypothetical protein KUCAC02_020924, partial [Chaenocephalus aceratus]
WRLHHTPDGSHCLKNVFPFSENVTDSLPSVHILYRQYGVKVQTWQWRTGSLLGSHRKEMTIGMLENPGYTRGFRTQQCSYQAALPTATTGTALPSASNEGELISSPRLFTRRHTQLERDMVKVKMVSGDGSQLAEAMIV